MCGICGFINLDGRPAERWIVERMTARLVHRGPDDWGIWLHDSTALGHRRLSIVDLARGKQPMSLPGSGLTMVYNGEVYNHRQIRRQLAPPPGGYQTECDTETVLAVYYRLGTDCLDVLRGMFALAVYDAQRGTLFLARDRLGIKPLYYYSDDRLFAFASEIKALLAHPEIKPRVNTDRLPIQLALKYTLDDTTLFRGIHKVPPGHSMLVEDGRTQQRLYWDLRLHPKQSFASEREAAEAFRERFLEAVELRLMADVPLGVFLSGGIDSSVIAAAMRKKMAPLEAFSVAFEEQSCNELAYSRAVARHLGATAHEIIVSPEMWFAAWPSMVYHEDEPIAHPSSIALHYVSQLAARHVKVVLTGEGSDELLAGYERYYQTLANLRWGRRIPQRLRPLSRRLIQILPDRSLVKRKAVRTSLYLQPDIASLFLDNYAVFSRRQLEDILQPNYLHGSLDGIFDPFAAWMERAGASDLLDQLLYADIKTYLVELLMKQDQMSMSASLESRVPFLDHELVEFAGTLPTHYKLKGLATKRILRMALGDMVPRQIVTRSKRGFPTPIRQWFRGEYGKQLDGLLLSSQSLLHEYVRPDAIRDLLERHRRGAWNLEESLWTLGNLEIWLRIFFGGADPEGIWESSLEPLACESCG